jgi:uncharacterized protein (TIGR02271 family)
MALSKLAEFDPQYRDNVEGNDIKGLGVYTEGKEEKIGTVHDALVDDEGHLRYLVVDLGLWIFGKKVLLPVGRTRIDHNSDRVYAIGLTREQAENLPEFNERQTPDYDYEEQVRGIYRNPIGSSAAVSATPARTAPTYDRDTYSYENEPDLFELNNKDNQNLKLYEERLIASKNRRKVGEVEVSKQVETNTARVSVPVEKDRVIIERTTPQDADRTVSAGEATFQEGEVARVEIYEEVPEIRKEAFVREEVKVTKVVDRKTVESEETVRREELVVNAPNLPIEER